MDAEGVAIYRRLIDFAIKVQQRWEREDAEKASASQADAPATKTDAPKP